MRPKLAGLEMPVKAAMLKSSHVLTTQHVVSQVSAKRPKLRRSLSSNHVDSPRKNFLEYDFPPPRIQIDEPLTAPVAPFMADGPERPSSAMSRSRRGSFDTSKPVIFSHGSKPSTGKNGKLSVRDISPIAMCTTLAETSSTQLELEIVKKLRLMLRNETAR